jgi:Kef-type K+ transport system membrane component KefB
MLDTVQQVLASAQLPVLLSVGLLTLAGLYAGKTARLVRLPSIIGFMLVGVILGPSLLDFLTETIQRRLSFITDVALGFVALSIGIELSLAALRRFGPGMVVIILAESFFAFVVVTAVVYALTSDLPLALIFGAVAPASAPAGTVAVIQEYRASGSLTKALYAVVGFDDGLGIIIFGFAAATARSVLAEAAGGAHQDLWDLVLKPLEEIGLSFLVGGIAAVLYCFLARALESGRDLLILTFAAVLLVAGVAEAFHLSLILTNLVLGLVVVNTQPASLSERIRASLTDVMPLLFVLFFVLAGANLHVSALPSLGLLGVVYIAGRTAGLMGGAWIGAAASRAEPKVRKYLGMGILSQAGVAIGLALVVKEEFTAISESGAWIGATVITTVTATSIFFEVIGPVLTKIGLQKAGEIRP